MCNLQLYYKSDKYSFKKLCLKNLVRILLIKLAEGDARRGLFLPSIENIY